MEVKRVNVRALFGMQQYRHRSDQPAAQSVQRLLHVIDFLRHHLYW